MPENSAAKVFAANRERLFKFIRSRVRLPEDAEDILQDVFYQFSRVENMAAPVEQAAAWLYRAAKNKIIDHYKKKKTEPFPVYYDEEEDDYVFEEIADVVFGSGITPETEYLRSMIFEEIKIALNDLPEKQRFVFEQTEFGNVPVKEIAEKTNAPVNTILSRKRYAVKFLQKRLKELYADVMMGE
jgi:RNA polymerase sigma factor (sigma-70 family)